MALPNVLLVHCHDLGVYLGCYGRDVDTPAIDDLAAGGARFDRHFVTAPQCSTSRGSLMTGLHPHENGLIGLAHGDWEIHPDLRVPPSTSRRRATRPTSLASSTSPSAPPAWATTTSTPRSC